MANERPPRPHIAVLHQAYVWDCEECGRENFQRAIVMSEEEKQADIKQMREDGEEVPEYIDMMSCCTYPVKVTCKHCSQEFTTADPNFFGEDESEYCDE